MKATLRIALLGLAALVGGGCAPRRAGPMAPPAVSSIEVLRPNRCSGDDGLVCRLDRDCPPPQRCLAVLTTNADVEMRDGGHTVGVGRRVLWMFGDTVTSTLELRSATAAWGSLSAPQTLREPVDDENAPFQFYPFTAAEKAFNRAHESPPACCGNQRRCPHEQPYCHCSRDTDCAARIALWPGDGVDMGGDSVAVYYEKFIIGVAPYDYRLAGTGIARVEVGRSVAVRDTDASGKPVFLFSATEPGFSRAVVGNKESEGYVYVYARVIRSGCAVDVFAARVPRVGIGERRAYTFWNGRGWSRDLENARPVLRGGKAGLGSVAWSDYLGSYVSAYSDMCTGGAKVLMRTALRPEGPWSTPVEVDLSPVGATSAAYYALLHPELRRGEDLVLSYFQPVGESRGQIRLVRLLLGSGG